MRSDMIGIGVETLLNKAWMEKSVRIKFLSAITPYLRDIQLQLSILISHVYLFSLL